MSIINSIDVHLETLKASCKATCSVVQFDLYEHSALTVEVAMAGWHTYIDSVYQSIFLADLNIIMKGLY